MDNEPYRDFTHEEAVQTLYWKLLENDTQAKSEYWLPNGKRADVVYLDEAEQVHVIEVKDYVVPSLLTATVTKYRSMANYLWLCCLRPRGCAVLGDMWPLTWSKPEDKVGLLYLSHEGTHLIRRSQLGARDNEHIRLIRHDLLKIVAAGGHR
jgi:hypothetical protein